MKRRGRHLEAVLLLLAVLLVPVACTEGDNGVSEREDTEPAPEFAGRILTTGGFRDPAMGIHDLAADTTERIRLPGDPEVIDAFWSESGDSAYVLAATNTADLGGSFLLATVCRRNDPSILVMDVRGPQRWTKVASGCSGALSPDGQEVVYSPDGRTLWTIATSGQSEPRKIADLEDLRGPSRTRYLRRASRPSIGATGASQSRRL